MLQVTAEIVVPAEELEVSYSRSSGPGGQNVNKVNSKAIVRWNVWETKALDEAVKARFLQRFASRLGKDGAIFIASDSFRDQKRNLDDCLTKLREMILLVEKPPKRRKPTKPSKTSVEKRLAGKRLRTERKQSRSKAIDNSQ